MKETVKIVPQYSECCFCDRPQLVNLEHVAYRPRFMFAKAAQQCAEQNGMKWGGLNKYKSAWATLQFPCRHRTEQLVRIDWGLEY